jgi:hypothetical protein
MEIIPVKIIPINNNLPNNLNNNLKSKDEQFIQLLNEIEYKKKMLLDKQQKISQITKHNVFLEHIKEDYLNYNGYIKKQKEDQVYALNTLNQYITDLKKSGNLSKHNISDAKHEQKKILNEINSIKTNLDELIKKTHI